jgi:hypothetical protein
MIRTLLTFLAVGFLALLAVGIALSVLGAAFALALGLASLLLFKVAPLLLIGWLVLKLLERWQARKSLDAPDYEWLENGR